METTEAKKADKKSRGLAIVSLVFGLMGNASALSTLGIVGVVCGHLALHKIKKNPDKYTGKGLAIAGLILGYFGILTALAIGAYRGYVISQIQDLGL